RIYLNLINLKQTVMNENTQTLGNVGGNLNQITPANNQMYTTPNDTIKKNIKTSTVHVRCPFCAVQGMTIANRHCSCSNLICCFLTTPVGWIIFQACRDKDYNCYDADHQCSNCKKNVANYTAC